MDVDASLNTLDYCVFVGYFGILIWLSFHFGKGQASQDDYYVGGRNLPWWAVGISTAATQTSAIGFMSIPMRARAEKVLTQRRLLHLAHGVAWKLL